MFEGETLNGDPEAAIRAIEAVTGLRICVHDLCGGFSGALAPERAMHGGPLCAAAKRGPGERACFAFEVTDLRPLLGRWPDGRIHRCHAGLIEWMVPLFDGGGRPLAVIFGGQRRAQGWTPEVVQKASGVPLPRGVPAVDEATAQVYLELLRQLALRLGAWLAGRAVRAKAPADRAARIAVWVEAHHTGEATIAELATELGLSPSRTAHAVREATGHTWRELVGEARLRTACQLLATSDLSLEQVALRCGLYDQSHLQRVFRKRLGTTPRRWREDREVSARAD